MASCRNCGTSLGSDEWFCSYCGEERSDCPECDGGSRSISFHVCASCGAAPEAPCEECGKRISASNRECPHCGYDGGKKYEEKAEKWSVPKALYTGGGALFILAFGYILTSVMGGFISNGILRMLFNYIIWGTMIITAGVYVLFSGILTYLSDSWGDFRESQSQRATAADIERAEKLHRSQEYVENQRRQKERKERKKKEQRNRTHVQCPECGWNVEMVVEGQVTNVQADTGASDAVDAVNSTLDTIGADETKECPYCGATVKVSTELT